MPYPWWTEAHYHELFRTGLPATMDLDTVRLAANAYMDRTSNLWGENGRIIALRVDLVTRRHGQAIPTRKTHGMQGQARRTDPSTSHEAAASVISITDKQNAVLEIIAGHGPLTDEELLIAYRREIGMPSQSDSGIRTRRNELVALNKVRACGHGRTQTGRRATLWGEAQDGLFEVEPTQHQSKSAINTD